MTDYSQSDDEDIRNSRNWLERYATEQRRQGPYSEDSLSPQQIVNLLRWRVDPSYEPSHEVKNLSWTPDLSSDLWKHFSTLTGLTPYTPQSMVRLQTNCAKELGREVEVTNSIGMRFRMIPPGTFLMGSPKDEFGRFTDEDYQQVTIPDAFDFGVFPVTQEQYATITSRNPSRFKGQALPVDNVNSFQAIEFCEKLSELRDEKESGYAYRLPSEAEWEYACRAGTTTKYHFGDSDDSLKNYAWYRDNSEHRTHPVGVKLPNPLGLYDLMGNVWEWCMDLVSSESPIPGIRYRVFRGGCWHFRERHCRSAARGSTFPNYSDACSGFRIVRTRRLA